MSNLITIGRFSELTQLTVKALRLYDKRNVLRHALVDFSSGYRYYSPEQVQVARRIHLLRTLDMPLDEIRSLLNEGSAAAVQARLAIHRQRLTERITSYQNALPLFEALDEWNESIRMPQSPASEGDVYRCSFCGKQAMEVVRMVAAPDGAIICNECVDECQRLMAAEESRLS